MKKINMLRFIILGWSLFNCQLLLSQVEMTIKVTVPNPTDEVYISGNQVALGNWNPTLIKLNKTSQTERELTVKLSLPAEFKFTRGSWKSEGKISSFFDENPNIVVNDSTLKTLTYTIKSWSDQTPQHDNFSLYFRIHSLYSNHFKHQRDVTVYLPKNYTPTKKYPVVYVLDGYNWFENFVMNSSLLSHGADYGQNSIPELIIVGILHQNRMYETNPNLGQFDSLPTNQYFEGPEKLKNHLFTELVPFINERYSTSGYNLIFGHSNTGHFVLNLPFEPNNPFTAIMSMSVNGENKAFNTRLKTFLINENLPIYIAYGTEDNGFNELAKSLQNDIEQKIISNNLVKVEGFSAKHNQLPQLAINSALKFLFTHYNNFDDFDEVLLNKQSLSSYLNQHENQIKKYGLTMRLTSDDHFTLLEKSVSSKNILVFRELVQLVENIENSEITYQLIVWLAKEIEDFETADRYVQKIIDSDDPNKIGVLSPMNIRNTFMDYFLNKKKNPEVALYFLEKVFSKVPESRLEIAFFYFKIATEYQIKKKKANQFLAYCKKNYRSNQFFNEEDLSSVKKIIK